MADIVTEVADVGGVDDLIWYIRANLYLVYRNLWIRSAWLFVE